MTDHSYPTPPLPGDASLPARVARMVRVDHAGEYGAARIYAGQLSVLGHGDKADLLNHMAEQEHHHLAVFSQEIVRRRVRPTLMLPLWHVAGFVLGAATARMGEKAAMACTVAVEEAIDEHYQAQIVELGTDEPALRNTIEEFRQEELQHRQIGLEHGAEQAPGYRMLSTAIKIGCKLAIRISERF